MNLRDSLKINNKGHLQIGGVDCVDLVKQYGTPLYVMDVEYIKSVVNAFKETIEKEYDAYGNIAYASKAFSTMAIYALMKNLNTNIDVVSEGEMFTALKAGYDLKNAYFHGNNKLYTELEYAIENNIGVIVIDNLIDIDRIDEIAKKKGIIQNVLIRINPGVEAHTHTFIQTSNIESKFGFSISNNDALEAIFKIKNSNNIHLLGLHSHIGSQIFETEGFKTAVEIICHFAYILKQKYDITVSELNLGGGFGVHYVDSDPKYTAKEYANYLKIIIGKLKECIEKYNLQKPHLMFEPGRSIVGEAGITLYSVGSIKNIEGIRKYVNIDGGMTDNIRPALYQAKYEAIFANRAHDKAVENVYIAGKCCESGDIIIEDYKMPEAKIGDIIAVFTTGAYNYSMASNYNRNPIPAVVMVEGGKSGLAVKHQSYEDIVRNDVIPDFIK